MGTLSAEPLEARRAYQREYRQRNRERINSQKREWNTENRDRIRQYNERYWQRVAEGKAKRASWQDYGIDEARRRELQEIAKDDKYSDIVLYAARAADKQAAEHIILSVTKNMSYEGLQTRWELREMERCPLGRTDFYGARRLFFHYLDCALKELSKGNSAEVPAQEQV